MIWRVIASEWVKLRRPSLLCGAYGAMAGVATLVTVLVFVQAGSATEAGGHVSGPSVSLARLARPDGAIYGLGRAAIFLGVIALAVAAVQIGAEYSGATLRNLLVRQPRRRVLLGGKYLAVSSFMLGAVLLAGVLSVIAAFLAASSRGISTAEWTSADGLRATAQGIGDLALSTIGYTTFGLVLGVFCRSSVIAIAAGIAFLLPFENILSTAIDSADRWLPGKLLSAIAEGGTSTSSLGRAAALVGIFLTIALAGALVQFTTRDVTA